jgi:hypothetical protein
MRLPTEDEKDAFIALASETGLSALILAIAEEWEGRADSLELEASLNYESEKLHAAGQWREIATTLRLIVQEDLKPLDEVICNG